jgi:hypothetical protein
MDDERKDTQGTEDQQATERPEDLEVGQEQAEDVKGGAGLSRAPAAPDDGEI